MFQSRDTVPYKSNRLDFHSNGHDGRLYANGVKFSVKVCPAALVHVLLAMQTIFSGREAPPPPREN